MTSTTSADVLAALRDAVQVVLELDAHAVRPDARLVDDLGADSLALVAIVEILEEQLGPLASGRLRIDDVDLDRMTTVGELVDYTAARVGGRPR